jgi:GAF domain-containing protein
VREVPDPTTPDGGAPAMPPDAVNAITFPQVARLELDELLEQLVARARDVQDTQGRLRGLLRANLEVARAVDLEQLLRHIVDAARDLVNARYAALGVVRQGRLVRFLHTGMDDATVAAIGHLPEGKGVLGRLVEHPEPMRLTNLADHLSSVGFPEHHPPMRSFLGVPIRLGDRVFGNLYLTDKQGHDAFTADDQELAQALATSAGVAIENATLFEEAHRRQQWQVALVEITTHLLSEHDTEQTLRHVVHHALTTSGADGASLCLPGGDPDHVRVVVTEGTTAAWQDRVIPVAGTAAGAAMADGRPVLILDLASDPRTAATALDAPGLAEATVAVPMTVGDQIAGVLVVVRSPGNGAFDPVDIEMISTYAAQAGVALQLSEVRHDNERLRMAEDRRQIAEDLHHRVIQRLFGLGLSLQALAPRVGNRSVGDAIGSKVEEVDEIIRDIRGVVFALNRPDDQPPPG